MIFTTVNVAQEISETIEVDGGYEVGAQLSHGAAGTESFEVRALDGSIYRVCVVPIPAQISTDFKPEVAATPTGPGFKLSVGTRVRSGAAGATYGQFGIVRPEPNGTGIPKGQVWIIWAGNVQATGYAWDSEVIRCLQKEG